MGVAKALPSMGAFTPIESMLKGGSASDLFSPKNWMNDTMMALQKPSTVLNAKYLVGQDDKGGKTLTSQAKEADKTKETQGRQNFLNKYGDAEGFRNRVNAGLQV